MDEAETKRALRALRDRADRDLRRLDEERRRIKRLIVFIDEYATDAPAQAPKPQRSRRRHPTSLLDAIRERPGIRTSMLAMIADRPSEEVAEELAAHERDGEIQRQGLGWRLAADAKRAG